MGEENPERQIISIMTMHALEFWVDGHLIAQYAGLPGNVSMDDVFVIMKEIGRGKEDKIIGFK